MEKKNLDFLENIKIAHRGLWNCEYPEISIGAFERAIDKGITIEFDIHLLKDDTLVVFHDDNLKRMTNKDILLKTCTYNDIKDIKLNNSNYHIPTLEEVLNLVDGKIMIDIELKTDVDGFRICEVLTKYLDKYKGKFIVKSFNPFYIWWFRMYRPEFIRGLLVSKLKKKKLNNFFKYALYNMWFNFLAKPDFIAFNFKNLPNKRIEKLRKRNIPILLFTVKEKDIINYKNYSGWLYEEEQKLK